MRDLLQIAIRRLRVWIPALLASAATLMAALVLVLAQRPISAPGAGTLPPTGYKVDSTVAALLPNGGRVIAVADWCSTCRKRAPRYIAYVARSHNRVLVIETDNAIPAISALTHTRRQLAGRVVYTQSGSFQAMFGLGFVPAYIDVDPRGYVLDSGASQIGFVQGLLSPRRWIAEWRNVIARTGPKIGVQAHH